MDLLTGSDKPLFFKLADPHALSLQPPPERLGQSVRTWVRSLTVMQKEALVINGRTGIAWRLASDEGAYLMGADAAPCPLAFLTTGMVCSYMTETLALARQRGITIRDIRLVQDNYYTMEGSALKGTMTGGALPVQLAAQIDSDADDSRLLQLLQDACAASPLDGLMRKQQPSLFTLGHNGRPVSLGKAKPVAGAAESDPGDHFEAARPAAGDWSSLVRRAGQTPRTAEADSHAGSSLAEHQNRRLHVRGICTLRADGVKQVEQHLYNPHGSIFRFLCDEAPQNGGRGLAPDAVSYMSAGIGFCFMTQFGRYAKIVKQDLHDYRISQNAFFSLGGASGETGNPGMADPLETHVHLYSDGSDDFARAALDMAEQSCFLHAFCRTPLKVRCRLARMGEEIALPVI